ncbi:MAG TPA: IS630 family transposase [Solirubrobacteraceae bacterium]|nr:IS630 family transposase [Solirubrobacteraceae bacterium]
MSWRRAQMVLLSAQAMDVAQIAKVTFTTPDRVRDVIHNFNTDGFESLYPRYKGGRPPKFTGEQRAEMVRIALTHPEDYEQPFSIWSLTKLAEYLVDKGVVEDISHEQLRTILRNNGVSFQRLKTWKESKDPDYEAKKERVLSLYRLADGTRKRRHDDPDHVGCLDEFGPLNLQPHPGRQWACEGGRGHLRRRRRRATFTRPHGVRHLSAAYDLRADRLYGHIKARKRRGEFLAFLRYVRSLYPEHERVAIILDNFSPHLTTKTDTRVGEYTAAHNIELVYVPSNASWLNRIEPQFTGLRYFALDGTDHPTHEAQGRAIRRYIAWRNRHPRDRRLCELVKRQSLPDAVLVPAVIADQITAGKTAGLERLRAWCRHRSPARLRCAESFQCTSLGRLEFGVATLLLFVKQRSITI